MVVTRSGRPMLADGWLVYVTRVAWDEIGVAYLDTQFFLFGG